ncbi:uncharacterized protein LOC131034691 isoform X1 [Cryptomeria japonica]|uniref:uncharacterized protein LOC131034691 isoform X1 n=2 Tax=Cryptomeria japonica TaxID=3369 RepID=UPI0027DA8FFB|nr:uncharacterized protein LOC131034691 isoform X1 [Cryptomeria japonica]
MMLSFSVASYHVGYSPGMPSVWSYSSQGLTGVRNICKPERTIDSIRELADGSLMFAFGESQPSGSLRAFHPPKNAKKANNSSSSHVEQITAGKNTFLKRTSSNLEMQSLIPISAEKTRNSIRNQREQDVDSDVVWDNFGSDKVNGKTHNVNHSKRVGQSIKRSSQAYGKGSVPKNGDSPALNEVSVDSEIVDLFKRLLSSIKKKNPQNKEKSYNHFSNSKFENRDHPTRSVLDQYNEKTKEEFKEDASRRHYNHFPNSKFEKRDHPTRSVWHQYNGKTKEESKEDASRRQSSMEEKVPARKKNLKRGPQMTKYEKKTKTMDKSLSEAFLLSRPPSNFVRRSPIPLSAIKQDVRSVPGMEESKFSFSEKKSTGQGILLQDSEEMPTSAENDSFLRDSPCLSEDKLNDSRELKLVDLKIDGSKLRDLEGTPTPSENGSVCRVLPSLSKDKPYDLSELKHVELKKIAKSHGLKGYSKLKKEEILELLRNAVRQS